MNAFIRPSLIALVLLAAACGKGGEDAKWPDEPTDGAPLVLEFIGLEGSGNDTQARMRIFNFGESAVVRMQLTLHYLDASGKELKDFPWSQQAPAGVVGGKGQAVKAMGAFIPEGTAKVTAEVKEVEFKDKKVWKKS